MPPKRTPSQDAALKTWLLAALDNATDADPGLLTDYVFALLSNNENMTKEGLAVELSEFLETDSSTFIDELFAALADQSYVRPYRKAVAPPAAAASAAAVPSSSAPSSIPPTGPAASASRKRGLSPTASGPAKAARLDGAPGSTSGPGAIAVVDESMDPRRQWQSRAVTGSSDMLPARPGPGPGMGRGGGMNGGAPGGGYQRKKGMCFSYHERGFCPRGMDCPYEHSADSIYAPGGGPSNMPMPFPPMMNGFPGFPGFGGMQMPMGMGMGMPGQPGPGFGMSPPGAGAAAGSTPGGSKGKAKVTELGEDVDMDGKDDAAVKAEPGAAADGEDDDSYSPNAPGQVNVTSPSLGPMSPPGMGMPGMPGMPPGMQMPDFMQMMQQFPGMMPGMPPPHMMGMPFGGMQRGRGGGRGGQRGRGGMQGGHQNGFSGEQWNTSTKPTREGNTLVITEVPPAFLNLEAVHGHFKQFGTVTNVAIEAKTKKALIAFAQPGEAYAAWKSDEPIFNSRHVKVFWHRPTEGQGAKGQEALEASAPLLENLRKIDAEGVGAVQGEVVTAHEKQAIIKERMEEMQRRQRVLEKHIAEQKVLMKRLEDKPDIEDRRQIKTRLKGISAEMDAQKALPAIDMAELQAMAASIKKPAPGKRPVVSNAAAGVHSMQDLMADQDMEDTEGVDADTLALRRKVKELRAKATSVGLDPDNLDAPSYGGRGRGRGRGRGASRGRGGPPRTFRLDNRTRVIAVEGEGATTSDGIEALRSWYAAYGMVGQPTEDKGKVVVSFESREAAESAMARGTTIPGLPAPVVATWQSNATEPADTPMNGGGEDSHKASGEADEGGARGERRDDD